jgi:hypothetical protein
MEAETRRGPIEEQRWPERLKARVTMPGAQPHVQGFDVQRDLARHYSFAEVVLVALTGDAPTSDVGRAFDIALTFVCPASVAEAPAHAAALARICGARTAGLVGVAATALAEQARVMFDEHQSVLPRLIVGSLNGMATQFQSRDAAEREAVQRLRNVLGAFCMRVPAIAYDLRLETAIIAVLLACGLRTRDQIEVAITMARLPVACAEALTWTPGDLRAYPMDLPAFVYEEVS